MRIAALTVLLVAVLPTAARAEQDSQLEGVYSWKGVDVDGREIGGSFTWCVMEGVFWSPGCFLRTLPFPLP
jgi:hypothetical protein